MATLSEKESVSARRVRHVRALRWRRRARNAALLLVVAIVPIATALLLTGGDDPVGTTSTPAIAEVLVRNFEGNGSTSTGVFVVGADWVLKWRLDGLASDSIRIGIRSSGDQDVDTIFQDGLGSGERAFEQGGAYRLVITSGGDWNIRVLQTPDASGG